MRRPFSFVRCRGQPGSAGAQAVLGLDVAARLPVPRIAIANKKESVVFIRLQVELIFSEVFVYRRLAPPLMGDPRSADYWWSLERLAERRLWFLIRECAVHCANTLCRNDRCRHMGL